jgi:beta-galactosidase
MAIKRRPYLAGAWIWVMFDYATTSREEGEAIDLNDKGLVSYDRRSRKDAFYFYKATLSKEPVLHITGRRYVDRAYPVNDVRAYSNAERASLTVNGRSMGEVVCGDSICVWPGVALSAGKNEIVARAMIAGRTYEDRITWHAPDPEAGLNILVGTLTGTTTMDGTRFGSDNFFNNGVPHDFIEFGQRPPRPTAVVAGDRPELYSAWREGNFSYELPLPDGNWVVTLGMFEPDSGKATSRRFDVIANGEAVLKDFSPAIAAGGTLKVITRRFPIIVRGGLLQLSFTGQHGAVLSAISVSRP